MSSHSGNKLNRPLILAATTIVLLASFWFGSRYPQLFEKAHKLPQDNVTSFIYSSKLVNANPQDSFVWRITASSINWLWSMRIGMSFGIALGALLHTILAFYPLPLTGNIYLNTLKGVLIGAPMGVCANCAVPIAAGLTRSKTKLETLLAFMFSSPTLNFVVVSMVFTGLPLRYAIIQYSLIGLMLLIFVPALVHLLRKDDKRLVTLDSVCQISPAPQTRPRFLQALQEVVRAYAGNIWSLVKTAVPMMILAAVLSSVAVELIPFNKLFANPTPLNLFLTSLITVLLPVPMAMDVMVAHHLAVQSVPAPYVALFLSTLGTYSILPMMYLWKEVSWKVALSLYAMFVSLGLLAAALAALLI